MSYIKVHHSYIRLNNSITHMVQYGCRGGFIDVSHQRVTPESLETISEHPSHQETSILARRGKAPKPTTSPASPSAPLRQVIVFVPGNPGILGVYHDFLMGLFRNVIKPRSTNLLIIGLSHNNFDHPDTCDYTAKRFNIDECELNFLERSIFQSHKPHDLELQVLNKLIILKKTVLNPNKFRVAFVGHSIGCYVILRMLQDRLVASAHAGSVMIHPALDNLAYTEKGIRVARYFTFKLDYVLRFLAYACSFVFDESHRVALAKRMCPNEFVESSSELVIESVAQLGTPIALKALIEMAKSEFNQVRNLDYRTLIGPHLNKLRLIYAVSDGWVHNVSRAKLKRVYPSLYTEEHYAPHAFVMEPDVVVEYARNLGMMVQELFDD